MRGQVFGVGVGPGDPELITLKALRLLQCADLIAYPKAEGVESFARAIAAPHFTGNPRELAIEMPMVEARFPAQEVYDTAATHIEAAVGNGETVVVLSEGDPFFYGSFMYLFARLADKVPVEVVPGVSSLMACAAAARMPLVGRNDSLTILHGPMDETEMTQRLVGCQAVAVMKVGRHLEKVVRVLKSADLYQDAVYVERATLGNEKVVSLPDLKADKAPYFSMILARAKSQGRTQGLSF